MNVEEAMARAIALSEGARGITSPNPPVGAVILDPDGHLVGEGATQPPGQAHAEVMALRQAGDRARGGTAVVTLEPCSHYGRTPPCAEALIKAGVARILYAASDPHDQASGGAEMLRAAGLEVEGGLRAREVRQGPLRAWLHFVKTGRPHVTWKYAATLDGRVAAEDGTSRWISSEESRAEVHDLRTKIDAIMVGTATVRADDPRLTARGDGITHQPLRVVVGKSGLPSTAKVLNAEAETIHLRTHDPDEVLAELARRGVVDVLLEGGPTLAGAFARAHRIDRVLAYVAPKLLGAGPVALRDAGVSTITEAVGLVVEQVTMCGPDVRISAVPTPR